MFAFDRAELQSVLQVAYDRAHQTSDGGSPKLEPESLNEQVHVMYDSARTVDALSQVVDLVWSDPSLDPGVAFNTGRGGGT